MTKKLVVSTVLVTAMIAAGVFTFWSHSSKQQTDMRRSEFSARMIEDVIPPQMEFLKETADTLTTAVDTLCATPTPEALTTAQSAWSELRSQFLRTSAYGMLPGSANPVYQTLYISGDPALIQTLIQEPAESFGAAYDQAGDAAKGFPAAEYLLWDVLPTAIQNGDTSTDGACRVLQATTQTLHDNAAAVYEKWLDGSTPKFYSTHPDQYFEDQINQLATATDYPLFLARGGLEKVEGQHKIIDKSDIIGTAHIDDDIRNSVSGIHDVFHGDRSFDSLDGRDHLRLSQVIAATNPDIAKSYKDTYEEILLCSTGISSTGLSCQESYEEFHVANTTTIPQTLGITLSFSGKDGD